MLDLGTSFLASVARDPHALAIVDGDMRLSYRAWHEKISALVAGFDELGLSSGRSSRHRAAEPLGGGDHPLGLPIRRHRRHAAQLALHRRGARFLHRRCRRQGDRVRAGLGRGGRGFRQGTGASTHRRRNAERAGPRIRDSCRQASARRRAARRCRGLVGDALYLGHDRAPQGRAAPPARGTRRGARACRAESLPPRRAHARRHAALSHHGGALAASDVADRRHLRLPAALRRGACARPDRRGADQQPLSRADALS